MKDTKTTNQSWPTFLEVIRMADSALLAFDFVADLANRLIGSKLTTATVFDLRAGRLRRIYSQNPEAYAVGGFKPIPGNKWTDTLLVRQQVYTALSIEEIAEDFVDWQLIRSLGCESILNIPVVVGGQVIGALNLLHEAGHYSPQRMAPIDGILPFATIAFLMARPTTLSSG